MEHGPRFARLRFLAMLSPYAAIAVSLYAVRSAWLAILLYHGAMAAYLILARPASMAISPARGWSRGKGLAASILCAMNGPLLILLWPYISDATVDLSASLAEIGLSGWSWWLFIGYYVGPHSILEEAFWRGAEASKRRWVAASDLLFAGYHFLVLVRWIAVPWALAAVAILTAAAWFWRRAATDGDGLAVPILSHAAAGVSTMAAVAYLARL